MDPNVNCKGSYLFDSACGRCWKCELELRAAKESQDLIAQLESARAEIERLKSSLDRKAKESILFEQEYKTVSRQLTAEKEAREKAVSQLRHIADSYLRTLDLNELDAGSELLDKLKRAEARIAELNAEVERQKRMRAREALDGGSGD